jgi:hypothetical protein
MRRLLLSLCCLLPVLVLGGCWSYVSPEARTRFESRQGRFSVTVYPVNVARRGKPTAGDFRLGDDLAAWMNERKIADARPGRPGAPIPVKWGANQARMAEQSAKAFGAWVKEAGVATDYALLAEILLDPGETKVIGVQYYIAERSGLLAAGGLANSHWDEFKAVEPVDRAGGLAVLKRLLASRVPGLAN